MSDITHKKCLHKECKTRPYYNFHTETKPLYCAKHKTEEMIDIINICCLYEECKTRPHYNFKEQTKGLYCVKHKTKSMVNVVLKTCLHEGCKKQPSFNTKSETKPLYCIEHKTDEMMNKTNKRCKSEWCFTYAQKKYDGYCLFCFINLFPDKPVSRNYKTKEYSVVEFVKTTFPNFEWKADRTINGGCSKRRPDLLLDLLYQIIIIEIDENQHTDYDCSCENKRIMELSQDVAHRPIVFIRFNPDDYIKNEKNITSCWGQNQKGICVVKKSKTAEWTQRLKALEEQIHYWTNPENATNKMIEIIQLFYDV